VLDETGATVAVIQEADRRFGARAAALPPADLAARGWRHVPFGMKPAAIGWHGNAVLVGRDVEILSHSTLTLPVLEPRGAVLARLQVHGRPLRVVGMHLDLSGLWRRRQARAILQQLADEPDVPTLLMGDMNEWRTAAGCLADFAASHKLVLTGPSFPARAPVARLDRIFASNNLAIMDSGVHQSPLAKIASDHLPLWVRVGLD
jgi:endonuclease/exonuclease/phosphatase family metal-dependent hydrolase